MTAVLAAVRLERVGDRLERLRWHHPEWPAALLAASAWAVLLALHGPVSAAHRAPEAGGAIHAAGGWLAMVAAMMVPSTLPLVRHVAGNSLWRRRERAVAIVLAAYLVVWAAFGLLAVPLAASARRVLDVPTGLLTAVLLGGAAAWELTPTKQRALRACHRPVPIPPTGAKADLACARFGVRHARACMAGCWPVMLAMAVAGHGSLLLMAVLTPLVVVQKLVLAASRVVRSSATVLAGVALAMLALSR